GETGGVAMVAQVLGELLTGAVHRGSLSPRADETSTDSCPRRRLLETRLYVTVKSGSRGASTPARSASSQRRARVYARAVRPPSVRGRDGPHRQAEPRDLAGQIEAQPAGDFGGEGRDDHLVEAAQVDRVLDRCRGVGVADDPLDLAARRLGELRQRYL